MSLVVKPVVVQEHRYPQPRAGESIGPAPSRSCLCSPSGSGKSSAGMTHLNAYFPVCTRIHLFSSTLELDPTYGPMRKKIREMLVSRGVDLDDPEEKFEHDTLADLGLVVNAAMKRTKEAMQAGAKSMPITYFYIDDFLGGSADSAGYRNNAELDRAFSRGRHAGAVVLLLS